MKNREFRINMRVTTIISLIAFLLGISGLILSYNVELEEMRGLIQYFSTLNMSYLPLIFFVKYGLTVFYKRKMSLKEIFSKNSYNEFLLAVITLFTILSTAFLCIFIILALIL